MTGKKILAVLAAAAGLATIGSAAHADVVRWGTVSGWDVMVDPSLGNGCFIYTQYDAGTALRLGFSPDDGEAYLMVGNKKWGSIEDGKDYDIELRLDRDSPWYATATGLDFDGLPFLMVETDEPDFLIDFAKKNSLAVTYAGQQVTSLSLRGTYAAVNEMLNCQDQVDKYGIRGTSSRSDPFAR